MRLVQDFSADFESLTGALCPSYIGSLAFARYADGEAAIMRGKPHNAKSDGWRWRSAWKSALPDRLLEALRYNAHGWHLGITAEDHHAKDHAYLMNEVRVEPQFVTFAEIFIFANYQRFIRLNLDHCLTIGQRCDVDVPGRPDDPAWAQTIDDLVPFMVQCSRPMLVSAGPWACVLLHEYWKRCPQSMRRVVLDVGSALDEQHKKRWTRGYQDPESERYKWVPRWRVSDDCEVQASQ